jgi:2-iminobutanoate/2-iminopropanoate deaminase
MKRIIRTNDAPAPIGPYSQAVEAGNLLYVSGQIAIDPTTNNLVTGSIDEETRQVINNILAILAQAGCSAENIVKTTIFLSDMSHFTKVNEIYSSYFESDFPARETVAVAGLPKNVNVEISVTAYKT